MTSFVNMYIQEFIWLLAFDIHNNLRLKLGNCSNTYNVQEKNFLQIICQGYFILFCFVWEIYLL